MAYKPEDFYVGQRVRIRDWDDMAEEFGCETSGNIRCYLSFTVSMEYLCGAEATITDLWDGDDNVRRVELNDWDNVDPGSFIFSTHMIEPVDSMTGVEFNSAAFAAMLGI